MKRLACPVLLVFLTAASVDPVNTTLRVPTRRDSIDVQDNAMRQLQHDFEDEINEQDDRDVGFFAEREDQDGLVNNGIDIDNNNGVILHHPGYVQNNDDVILHLNDGHYKRDAEHDDDAPLTTDVIDDVMGTFNEVNSFKNEDMDVNDDVIGAKDADREGMADMGQTSDYEMAGDDENDADEQQHMAVKRLNTPVDYDSYDQRESFESQESDNSRDSDNSKISIKHG